MGKSFKEGHEFPAEFGFTGSAGKSPVRPHMRNPRQAVAAAIAEKMRGTQPAGMPGASAPMGQPLIQPAQGLAKGGKPKLGTGARFASLKSTLAHKPGVTDPGALAAAIGAKKYGRAKMSAMAAKGRKG